MDLQWCPDAKSKWALLSISEDSDEAAGGTMQIWRMNDMVYRPRDEVVAELEAHRDFIVNGKGDPAAAQEAAKAGKGEGGGDGAAKMDVDA